jgi:proline-specific peptidase
MGENGLIEVPGGRVWHTVVGAGDGLPLLCLHGGPGLPHDYISSMADVGDTRPVVFYDQLGCGRSERPDDPSLWQVQRFVDEVTAVRRALGLDRLHIFGSSWGGTLAMQYLLSGEPDGVASLILAGSPARTKPWLEYADELRAALPADVRDTLTQHEARGYFKCPEFQGALAVYYKRHLCRMHPWPDGLEAAFERMGTTVYEAMWGPTEFGPCTGVLKDFDVLERLGEIAVPTLLTIGRYDECPPSHYDEIHARLPNSELVHFEESSHTQFFEERELYMQVVRDFLARVEASGAAVR